MTDKVQKIREEVEKLKSQLLRGACSSQIAMETRCKEEAYNEVLAILDSLQEEHKKCMYTKDNYTDEDRKVLCDDCEEECKYAQKEEPVSEELGDYINELSKQFPEVSFAKLSRIAVRVAKWQKEQMMKDALNGLVYAQRTNGEVMFRSNYVRKEGFWFGDKVKLIIIKGDWTL